jgi:hypothetical protein
VLKIRLTADEAIEIRRLCRLLGREYGSTDDEDLLRDLGQFPEEMPAGVAEQITDHMDSSEGDFALISHHMVCDHDLGKTPTRQKDPARTPTSLEYEMVVMLYGSIVGEVFGWGTQQDGHIVNDIIPTEAFADRQEGADGAVDLVWHTEDAYHPGQADFTCLFCLRNPTGAVTTVAPIVDIEAHQELVLEPGDLLILNNHRVVHGRRPFKPTYNRRGHWLKRVNVGVATNALAVV